MMITVLNSLPYQMNSENYLQSSNEVVLIFCTYHLLVYSDFVPAYEKDLKNINGLVFISLVTFFTAFYLVLIILSFIQKPLKQFVEGILRKRR